MSRPVPRRGGGALRGRRAASSFRAAPSGSRAWRQLLSRPGAARLVAGAFAGRLAYGMLPVAVFLALSRRTSLREAAVLASAQGVVASLVFPRKGRAVDRHGLPALHWLTGGAVLALAAAGALAALGVPVWPLFGSLLVVGLASPPVTSTVLAGLTRVVGDRDELTATAFALDAGLAEAAFLAGPALGGVLAAAVGPGAALGVVALLLAGATGLLASVVPAAPAGPVSAGRSPTGPAPTGPRRQRLATGTLLAAALLGVADLGAGLASASIAVLARDLHSSALYGVLLSLDGVGALLGVVLLGRVARSLAAPARVLLLTAAGPALTVPLLLSNHAGPLLLAVTLLGLPVAALSATVHGGLSQLQAGRRLNEAFSFVLTAQNLAGAAGFATGGVLLGSLGQHGPALAGALAGAGSALLLAPALARRLSGPANAA